MIKKYPHKKLYLIAGSVGAIHALSFLETHSEIVQSVVLAGPAIYKSRGIVDYIYKLLLSLGIKFYPHNLFGIFVKLAKNNKKTPWLESTLKSLFPMDLITPVAKGVLGADISHTVKSPLGADCGVILWESKRTKAWSDSWISKLKEDLRSAKANIPAIVSDVVPETAKSGIGFVEGIWVATAKMAPALAMLLRKSLLDTARERAAMSNQKEKSALLYGYVTGHEFSQNVEMMLETYKEMQELITKERMAMERSWKLRETQVQKLMSGVSGVYGSLQGIAGPALPNIKQLELD